MKKNILKILFPAFAGLLISCSDYLDVQPEDKLLEDQVYTTEAGINSVLNGIYTDMAGNESYGGYLTMSVVELLAQRYVAVSGTDSRWYDTGHYAYEENKPREYFDEIWTSMYGNILKINDLIANVDAYGALAAYKASLVKGEAYGLRAMLHFDLLRLFGPVYGTNPGSLSIPYYTQVETENGEILPASEVMAMVIADLEAAEELLMDDPVLDGAITWEGDVDFYASRRNHRLNYYAVKALQARAYLYAGNRPEALAAAKMVIEEAGDTFPWTVPEAVVSAGGNPDRIFSSEVIFGLSNLNLYNQHRDLFSSDLEDANILAPEQTRIEEVFENNESDYRYNSSWKIPASGGKEGRTFFKYEDIQDKNIVFRFMQPLIRMSEMYYIAAEAETSEAQALEYLNTVRYNRGLHALETGTDIDTELLKEYRKEFFGEGQLFFYYKRKNTANIPDGSSSSGTINTGEEVYVIPLPDSETKYQ
ncbi:RagB/SusD family nutrient uptake outer membrane protein [Sinomicrobium soli]|uniref:RagB/SusD family nutrient uptake outer membrane protein n=1 Tax=Sinomicrobium sp. N-1-3-6 TaxID=2219864 RepID=UPI000DCBC5FC|nr:RagB/SusD family nutrient uptake outer membrane protein [Sinomicrobium sp. N-1-3-6]RAV28944.1 hypothetical protein DN748_11165 [Sinomicrobium sp. N-1-3-6]